MRVIPGQEVLKEYCPQTAKHYPFLPRFTEATRMHGGERNNVYLLRGEDGSRHVMRIIHHLTELSGVEYTNAWSAFVARFMPQAISPYLTKDHKSYFLCDGLATGLYPFADGVYSDREVPEQRDALAAIQARLHLIGLMYPDRKPRPDRPLLLHMDFEENFLYNWKAVLKMLNQGGKEMFEDQNHQNGPAQAWIQKIYECRGAILEAKKDLEEFQRTIQKVEGLVYAPIHGDMYGHNILVRDNHISGILDWDECNREVLVYELARTCWEYCKDSQRVVFIQDRAERYLNVYQKNKGPAPESQWPYMIPLLRMLKFSEVMLYLHNAIIGDVWDPGYGYENLRALMNLEGYVLIL